VTTPRWLGALVLAVWALSLAAPVFTTCAPGYDHVPGFFLLALGWFGIFALMPAWFANFPIVWIGARLFFRRRQPVWPGGVAVLIAGTALWWKAWGDDTGERPICHYHAGYYLWLASALLALVATIVAAQSQARPAPTGSGVDGRLL
jgi:hypothetical protein